MTKVVKSEYVKNMKEADEDTKSLLAIADKLLFEDEDLYDEINRIMEKSFEKKVKKLCDEILDEFEEPKSFKISKTLFYKLGLSKYFEMDMPEETQRIKNFEHDYYNKYHDLKFKAEEIELYIPPKGDTFITVIKNSSLTRDELRLFAEEISRYWRLKSSDWRFNDMRRKIEYYDGEFLLENGCSHNKYSRTDIEKKQLNIMRSVYLSPNERKLIKTVENSSYIWDEMNEYEFEEIEEFIEEIEEYLSHRWVKNKDEKEEREVNWSKGLQKVLIKYEDYDLYEVIDILQGYYDKTQKFVEGDFVQDHKTRYEDFVNVDKNKRIIDNEHRNYVQGRARFKSKAPEWSGVEKPFPGLKEILDRK